MFKLIRYSLSTIIFISVLAYSGVIEFTAKGEESLMMLKSEIKNALIEHLKGQNLVK